MMTGRQTMSRYRRTLFLSLTVILGLSTASCKKEKAPDPTVDYGAWLRFTTDRMCEKMLRCNEKYYRGISPTLLRQITQENCVNTALRDIDQTLPRQTPEMKSLSVACYNATLNADCKKFMIVNMIDPSCRQLRKASALTLVESTAKRRRSSGIGD